MQLHLWVLELMRDCLSIYATVPGGFLSSHWLYIVHTHYLCTQEKHSVAELLTFVGGHAEIVRCHQM